MSLILPSKKLYEELSDHFTQLVAPRDRNVVCPSLSWLKKFGRWCKRHPWRGITETQDCDDAAWECVDLAGKSLKKNRKLWGHGHAVLLCYVEIADGKMLNGISAGRHATNLVRTPEAWHFLERQTGRHEELYAAVERDAIADFGFVLL